MTKHYTELTGASGDRVHFAPVMQSADQFFNGAVPEVRIGKDRFRLASIGPLGFTLEDYIITDSDDEDTLIISICQGNEVLLYTEVLSPVSIGEDRVEFRCFNQPINLEALLNANAVATVRHRASKPRFATVDIPSEYKSFCADTLDIMATLRQYAEKEIAPFEGALTDMERMELQKEMEGAVSSQWLPFLNKANSLVLPYKDEDSIRLRMKKYTENVVTAEMCKGALQRRCYTKPLGYPGDYQIMNAFYDNVPRGSEPYSRLVDMLGLIAGRPVTKRMHSVSDELEKLTNSHDRKHFHVMSVGSGPAREFRRFFEKAEAHHPGFSITLVDTEPLALDCAIKNIYSSVKNGVSSIMVSGMNTSFTDMLRPKSTFRHLPAQDFIYSAGLTDYLNTKLTRALLKKLYDLLRPGGTVLIGNINDSENGMYWSAEYAVDWSMYFRNMSDMEEIADGLPGDPQIELDDSGSYYMLKLTKPA